MDISPVVTIVVYYLEKQWDGTTTLHEILRIPKEFAAYVNNYKMMHTDRNTKK